MERTYSELVQIESFRDRFEYLSLHGKVAFETFGPLRLHNQRFYVSHEWRTLRNHIITRDNACDMAFPGNDIYGKVLIHHINPITPNALVRGSDLLLDPENLISVSHQTHNAIHYGDGNLLPEVLPARRPGDTLPWNLQRKGD